MLRHRQDHGPHVPGKGRVQAGHLGHQRIRHRGHRQGTVRPGLRLWAQGRYFLARIRRKGVPGYQGRLRRRGHPHQLRRHRHQQQDVRRADGPGYHPYHRHQHQGGDVRHPAVYQGHERPSLRPHLQHHLLRRHAFPAEDVAVRGIQVGRHRLVRFRPHRAAAGEESGPCDHHRPVLHQYGHVRRHPVLLQDPEARNRCPQGPQRHRAQPRVPSPSPSISSG